MLTYLFLLLLSTSALANGQVDGQDYFVAAQPNSRVEAFNRDLKRQDPTAKIVSCRKLVDVPVGTAHGNHSFGGLCERERAGKKSKVEICNDDMVGHFKMQDLGKRNVTTRQLAKFIIANCFGG